MDAISSSSSSKHAIFTTLFASLRSEHYKMFLSVFVDVRRRVGRFFMSNLAILLLFLAILRDAAGFEITTQAELMKGIESHKKLILGADLYLAPSFDEHTAIAIQDVANLTILGNGHTLDGGGRVRCLFIANSSVTMKDVRIMGCDAGQNVGPTLGHTQAKSYLRPEPDTASAKQGLLGPHGGGAIFASDSKLNMTNCKITFNSATGSYGAGMYLTGPSSTVTCNGCHFSSNSAAHGSDVYLAHPDIPFTTLGCPIGHYHGDADGHALDVHGDEQSTMSFALSYTCYQTTISDGGVDAPVSRLLQTVFQPADRAQLLAAVDAWCANKESAIDTYGAISTWNTALVTDMSELLNSESRRNPGFACSDTFNEDISSWDTSSVTNML